METNVVTESQVIRGITFERIVHRNAGGIPVRYEPWEIANWPSIDSEMLDGTFITIDRRITGREIDVSNAGADISDIELRLVLTPADPICVSHQATGLRADGSLGITIIPEIVSFDGTTINFTVDLRWRHVLDWRSKRPEAGTGDLYLLVKSSGLMSDPVTETVLEIPRETFSSSDTTPSIRA